MAEKTTVAQNSTQQFVEVQEVKDGVVILKNGGLRAVVMVSGVNFELKSEQEQDIMTSGYQDFLNSLDFSIQIIIHSRKLNIENYLTKMQGIRDKEPNELLRNQIDEYVQFIRSFVKENEIMTKNFFVIIPYDAISVGQVKSGIMGFLPFGGKKKKKTGAEEESFEQRISQLRQRIDQVLVGVERMGLRAVALNDEELLELYYNLYNPESVEKDLTLGKPQEQEKVGATNK